MFTSGQLRAGRGLLGWSQTKLSKVAGVSQATVKRMEGALGPGRSSMDNVTSVQQALEEAGVEFIPENGGGPGVRLKKITN